MFKLPCFFLVFLWWLLNTFTRENSSKSFRYAQEPYAAWLSFSAVTGPILYQATMCLITLLLNYKGA